MFNLIVITADDLSFSSLGSHTPNMVSLAKEGYSFENAHTNVAICQPSRSTLMTGLYPHNNGSVRNGMGISNGTTLSQVLNSRGYRQLIMGKTAHHTPPGKFMWDKKLEGDDRKNFRTWVQKDLAVWMNQNKPFFVLANIPHPHRPFLKEPAGHLPIPNFLPNNPHLQEEMNNYVSSVSQCDKILGDILEIIPEKTYVVFTSDHGMSMPFVKANCYYNSTHVPLIYRGERIPHNNDSSHIIPHIDMMPTILDLLEIEKPTDLDGRSYVGLFDGLRDEGRQMLFTSIELRSPTRMFISRGVLTPDFNYVLNFNKVYIPGMVDGWDWARSVNSLPTELKRRFEQRPQEELFDQRTDPDNTINIAAKHPTVIQENRNTLLAWMQEFNDPMLGFYLNLFFSYL